MNNIIASQLISKKLWQDIFHVSNMSSQNKFMTYLNDITLQLSSREFSTKEFSTKSFRYIPGENTVPHNRFVTRFVFRHSAVGYNLEFFKRIARVKYHKEYVLVEREFVKHHVIKDNLGNKAVLELNEKNEVIAFHRVKNDWKSNLHRLAILIMLECYPFLFLDEDDWKEFDEYYEFLISVEDLLEDLLVEDDSRDINYKIKKLSYYENKNHLSIDMSILFKNIMENKLNYIANEYKLYYMANEDKLYCIRNLYCLLDENLISNEERIVTNDYIEYYGKFCNEEDEVLYFPHI